MEVLKSYEQHICDLCITTSYYDFQNQFFPTLLERQTGCGLDVTWRCDKSNHVSSARAKLE